MFKKIRQFGITKLEAAIIVASGLAVASVLLYLLVTSGAR